MHYSTDSEALSITRRLVRCPSVTPQDGGAIGVVEAELEKLGFSSRRLTFGPKPGETSEHPHPIENVFAWRDGGLPGPTFCFAGHTDVVPIGDPSAWSLDPFAAEVRDGRLYGRGVADMKGAIGAFIAATAAFLAEREGRYPGRIALLITGDEEGPALYGTKPVLEWMAEEGFRLNACIVGEPTNPKALGEMVKTGRRGSLSGVLIAKGRMGHIAYPQRADNAAHRMVRMLSALISTPLDSGNAHFEPSSLQISSIDIGNPAGNVVPARAEARFNIRFNTEQGASSLEAWLRNRLAAEAGHYELQLRLGGEAFLTEPGPFRALLAEVIAQHTGRTPLFSTSGGTSDARFIKDYCPVVEFGLTGETVHQVDENVRLADLEGLTAIYKDVLIRYFQ